MKKTILMMLAALGLAGMAQADYSVTLDSTYYNGLGAGQASWVYVWTGSSTGEYGTATNWSFLRNTGSTSLEQGESNKPVNYDPAFIGYDFSYVNGQQIMTANDTAITVTAPTWMGNGTNCRDVFLGNNVTISGTNNGFDTNTVSFHFGDMSQTRSSIQMADFWKRAGTVNFTGTLDMTSPLFKYTLFHSTKMYQNVGTWNADFTITDQYGETLQYAEMDSENVGKDGYYWLEAEGVADGNNPGDFTISIVAQATPEPTTATLSLLALAGLCALRRRK